MSSLPLKRVYCFSDTYGRSKNPFLQDDADALISTDFRSFPTAQIKRDFDIYGREIITEHVLRLIFELDDALHANAYMDDAVKQEYDNSLTGVFINAAPRLTKENGAPFYVAQGGNVRIVTTNLHGLSSVKHKIESLHRLDNDKNTIYGRTEQFRSSYTAYLLHPDHGVELIEEDVQVIPDYPENVWVLSYVDRFGNMITYTKDTEKQWRQLEEHADSDGKVKVIVGNVSQTLFLGSSLRDAEPGAMVVYKNKDIDILRKWVVGEDSYTLLYRSAFLQYSKPEVGSMIKVAG